VTGGTSVGVVARRCDRPGCSDLAAVAFGFDATRLLVWLDNLVDDDRAKAGALCQRHADRLTAPKGWWLDDRRVEVPDLFHANAPEAPPAPPAPGTRRTSRRRSRKPAPEVVATVVEEPVLEEHVLPDNLVPLSGFEDTPAPTEPPRKTGATEVTAPAPSKAKAKASLPPPGATGAAIPPPPVLPTETEPEEVDPIFEPSTPLLARAFTGTARPDRPHHRQRRPDRPDPAG